ncbi:MAG: substrate-binding domain-containing protein [Methanimicrococcus sp.]|nr:substrate-binding domain-containing protein [Methanimicrococcus sp.]
MKKMILVLLLVLVLLAAGISGCLSKTDNSPTSPQMNDKIEIPEMNPPMPLPEYPEIDGSSSTITMHAAIRAYLTDAYFVDSHSQTYAALERIIPGSDNPADVILAVKYYDETLQDAQDRGADLVITPIAKEGFVFVLHKDNPVNNLTQQQLRDIYSGKITNWKEVGGKDEKITPYLRNWDSGSQTAMEDFMNGEPIIGSNDLASSMGGVLTLVQVSGSRGIGYNIYSWSMEQNLESMGLKVVAVDGIKPDNKNLSDSSYPLMIYTYSYYNNGNDKGKALTDWLLTAEGQNVIARAGYVGIFGELSTDSVPDYNIDENNSKIKMREYYANKENPTLKENLTLLIPGFSYSNVTPPMRLPDKE